MEKNPIKEILKFRDERDWKQFHSPKNLAISLALEAAEILETFQWTADNQLPGGKKEEFELEIADVYYYLLLLAYETGVKIDEAFEKKMELNRKRYPISKAKGNSRKYDRL